MRHKFPVGLKHVVYIAGIPDTLHILRNSLELLRNLPAIPFLFFKRQIKRQVRPDDTEEDSLCPYQRETGIQHKSSVI